MAEGQAGFVAMVAERAAARIEGREDPTGSEVVLGEKGEPHTGEMPSEDGENLGQDRNRTSSSGTLSSEVSSVIKSGSIFPTSRPTPVLVRMAGDADGQNDNGAGFLLLKEEPSFGEVHKFTRRVRVSDFDEI